MRIQFRNLTLRKWRQFNEVSINFERQATILTGTNGSGKTTLLNALAMHFGWQLPLVAAPRRRRRLVSLWSDVHGDKFFDPDEDGQAENTRVQVGAIDYSNGARCELATERFVSANYQLNYGGLQPVSGLFIPSHRAMSSYNPVSEIPVNPVQAQQQYQQYQQFMLQLYGGGNAKNPGNLQKKSLMAFAAFGEGNSAVSSNEEYRRIFQEFQKRLRIVLPREIGFKKLEVRNGDLVLITKSGDFSIDSMSGGVSAIFGIIWQISMYSPNEDEDFTVLIDEPENHLHPSMQKDLLPSLAKAYPSTKFIVATHSPFIVSSFEGAAVYALSHNKRSKVDSTLLERADLSGSPNKILRDILGVSTTLPKWVETSIDDVIRETSDLEPEVRGKMIMARLSEIGLASELAEFSGPRG